VTQPADTVPVVLRLDRTAEPIAGSLDDGSGGPRAFYGWLELSAMLEQTRAVGGYFTNPHAPEVPLSEVWNGQTWTIETTP
jgi:hypothetical protein